MSNDGRRPVSEKGSKEKRLEPDPRDVMILLGVPVDRIAWALKQTRSA